MELCIKAPFCFTLEFVSVSNPPFAVISPVNVDVVVTAYVVVTANDPVIVAAPV